LADEIFASIQNSAELDRLTDTIIDVSSFRREELLILLAALNSVGAQISSSCDLLYVRAADMDRVWLSRNVLAYRSVIGFAGDIWPSRKTKIVILLGFEIDRARAIIENYEPAEVVIGVSSRAESMNEEFNQQNRLFHEDLLRQFAGKCSKFEFSARDPLRTAEELRNALAIDTNTNIIVAPLNTKLSTLGAGLYALENRSAQICYTQIGEYNEANYSKPGTDVFQMGVTDLLRSRL